MLQNIKKILKWGSTKNTDPSKKQKSIFLCAFFGVLEDVLLWKYNWLSLTFILIYNVLFFVCVCKQLSLLRIMVLCCITVLGVDAFETWLKYRHRNSLLKKIADHDAKELNLLWSKVNNMLQQNWSDFIFLREKNPTKAFLLLNIIFSTMFLIGTYVDGYVILYLQCMFICLSKKLMSPLQKVVKKIKQHAESDADFEGLLPEVSEVDIKLLSIEPEFNQDMDEKQTLDFWKPEDLPLDEASDSSDNSSSLVSNLTIDKRHTMDKDIDESDSSEDEYIPLVQQKEQLQTTLEVSNSTNTWSSSAYNSVWNFTGAIVNMVYTKQDVNKRNRVSSADSSDGFEMVDKNELL